MLAKTDAFFSSHCVLIARTDSESASRITSTIDPADRPFILGRTNLSLPSLSKVLSGSKTTGADRLAEETAWEEASNLTTLDEAVAAVLSGSELEEWKSATAGLNTSDALIKAQELGIKVVWDAEGCRNLRGWYRYKGGIDAAIARSIAFAPYSDMLWSCAPGYNFDEIVKLEKEVHSAVPGKWLGYNWSFGYFTGS
jgi:isocitrate lyase